MLRIRLYLFFVISLICAPPELRAITQQEAEAVIDSIFIRNFQQHYLWNVSFYDGGSFRIAYAVARSGAIASGGCGHTLTNASIGVTFDSDTDSVGSNDEGITIFIMVPPSYSTTDSARNGLENFIYENITGTADVQRTNSSGFAFSVYPNPSSDFVVFTGLPADMIFINNILGQKIFSRRIDQRRTVRWNTHSVSSGQYIYAINRSGKNISRKLIKVK
jgi:hypothetical protein